MSNGLQRMCSLIVTGGLASAVALTAVLRTGVAQEAIPCPPASGQTAAACDHPAACPAAGGANHLHRVILNDQGQLTIYVTKLPALGQVFREACLDTTCCEELFERLAANVQVATCQQVCNEQTCNEQKCNEQATGFFRIGCPISAGGPSACCSAAAASAACQNCAGTAKCQEPVCGDDTCAVAAIAKHDSLQDIMTEHHPLKLLGHMVTLVGEKAAAQAALAAQRESHEELSEMYETMAELIAANAALQVRIEAQAEHAKLAEKLADLAAENARLKTHVELAAERAESNRAVLSMSLDNERLKQRLAELEQKQAVAEAARTAQRTRAERKSR